MNLWETIKVVYVEDQAGARQSVAEYFELHTNGRVKVVFDSDSGPELLDFLRRAPIPMPDLCILDISMPKMDGLTLLKHIHGQWSKLPCLIYSMHTSPMAICKSISLGAKGYLSKQHDYKKLYEAVLAIHEKGIAYTEDAGHELFHYVLTGQISAIELSERERVFIRLASSDMSYTKIATEMGITKKTVENYRDKCYRKLNVTTKAGLTLAAVRLGIVNI